MDFRNFTTRAGAILGAPPPVYGKRTGVHHCCMQDTFARATHSAGRPSAARDDRVSCIQASLRLPRYFKSHVDVDTRNTHHSLPSET